MRIDLYENLKPTGESMSISEQTRSQLRNGWRAPIDVQYPFPRVPLSEMGTPDSMTISFRREYYEPIYENHYGHPTLVGMQKLKE